MKTSIICGALALLPLCVSAQDVSVKSPDGRLAVGIYKHDNGSLKYNVTYDGKEMLLPSPLGFIANIGNYRDSLTLKGSDTSAVDTVYSCDRIKRSSVNVHANRLTLHVSNNKGNDMSITFHVSNNDVAFRYNVARAGETGSIRIMNEATGFRFPSTTTTFLCPQSDAMIGWKRTKPSYEEEYHLDAPLTERSQYGHGFTFPCLFHEGNNGWVLIGETGVDSRYCASRLSDASADGTFSIAFPMAEENNGNGTSEPAFALPGSTPWRTLTVGSTLKPIAETTITWDVVDPIFPASQSYSYGKSTWSWIISQDNSINYDDQVRHIDLAAAMGYQYTLIDCGWDVNIGRERMAELARYAASKGVSLLLWYSSSGYWNDITQSPINCMDRSFVRRKEMAWLKSIGVKGIKVDFFGGDKQETMRLYEDILADANDFGLTVIFHGCTIPRGWERMYPNYVGSEAVLASENLIFQQHFCDMEAQNAALHPFIRNTLGSMEFGGTFLNNRMSPGNDSGNTRRTGLCFELALAVLFQNAVQNFALTPANLTNQPAYALDFMREVPTTWDETQFLAGYPGRYAAFARRHAGKWYVAAINAAKEANTTVLELPMFAGKEVRLLSDGVKGNATTIKVSKNGKLKLTLPAEGGAVITESAK